MSLEVELDCDGLLSKHDDEMLIDTEDTNSNSLIIRNAENSSHDDFKDLSCDEHNDEHIHEHEDGRNMNNRRHRQSINDDNSYNLDMIKQRELMQHLEELRREFASRINILESNLDSMTREKETFESKVIALQQEKQYLQENATECNRKYNQCRIALQSANEEVLDLKTELINLQLLYEEEIKMVNNENTLKFNLNDINNENNPINRELQQYMKENLEIRKENKKYLDQLKQINDKYRESNTKYNDLNNIQIDLQNELNLAKSRCGEFEDIQHELLSQIQILENQNADLKQTLSEIKENHENLFDKDGNAIEIDYAPTISTRGGAGGKRHFRARSYSQVSQVSYNDSVCNSPVVNPSYECNIEYDFDLYAAVPDSNMSKGSDGLSITDKSDEMEKFYDLYEAMNDYLEQMQECVHSIKTIQLLKHKKQRSTSDLARASSFHLLSNQATKKSIDEDRKSIDDDDEDTQQQEQQGENNNDNNTTDDRIEYEPEESMDDDEEDGFAETLLGVLDTNDDEMQLSQLLDLIQDSKECVLDLNKQQVKYLKYIYHRY